MGFTGCGDSNMTKDRINYYAKRAAGGLMPADWPKECFVFETGVGMSWSEIQSILRQYAEHHGYRPLSAIKLAEVLRSSGANKIRTHEGKLWIGLRRKEDHD
jgi:hypothetical protein